MTTYLAKKVQQKVAEAWQWRDRTGTLHAVESMTTRHLWYTLRMIWNHTMPEDARLQPYKGYYFPEFYTAKYLKQGIRLMTTELSTRTHLPDGAMSELRKMIAYLQKPQLEKRP